MKIPGVVAVCMLVSILLGGTALAHKVTLFAYAEAATIHTESYFPDGRPVANGKVMVYDSGDILLLEGRTDPEGLFSFPIPKVDDLNIVLDASMGHKASFKLNKAEVEAGK
jgi:nickel transport protein